MTYNYLFWRSLTHFMPNVGFWSSFVFGTILLILNTFGVRKIFGAYKYLISAFTMLGMVFAAVEIIVYPNVHNYNAGFLFFSLEKYAWFNDPRIENALLMSYTFLYAATISLLSVQFIYRYWAIFDNAKLKYFGICYSPIWATYCAFFGFQYSLGAHFFLELDQVAIDYFQEEMLMSYSVNITDFPAKSIVAYDPVDGSARWWNIMGILNICSIVNIQYGIMIYCGWSMHKNMEAKLKNFSVTLRNHHKQFFKSLVMQITAPTIILFIPITIIIFLPLFDLNISMPSGAMLCSFTLYPAMDSMIVMYVVSDYRKTARKGLEAVLKKLLKLIKRPTTNYEVNSTKRTET